MFTKGERGDKHLGTDTCIHTSELIRRDNKKGGDKECILHIHDMRKTRGLDNYR